MNLYPYLRPLLTALEPEKAHRLTLLALKAGLGPVYKNEYPPLRVKLWGREFSNPLGLAAGFDKDAEAIAPLLRMGFGFIEAGTVTPKAQPGNARPRVFRDSVQESLINRLGFPGKGVEVFSRNVLNFRQRYPIAPGLLGINIGINKETAAPLEDYRLCLERLAPLADYIAINVSSPNTAGLRNLQGPEELERLLAGLMPFRTKTPVLLKIAPDLSAAERADIAAIILRYNINGLIVSNTTVTRPDALTQNLKNEEGGLSGRLLTQLATEIIRDFYRLTQGTVPIIGVGGISSAVDAYEKIRAGASLIQLYTALVYQGPQIITRILEGLTALLARDGFQHVSEAVGAEMRAGKARGEAVG